MRAIKKFLFRQAERRLKKIPALYRGQARFKLHYPGKYTFGIGSYGLPKVHDWNEGATLRIGSFCSIAENVQILLGGHHHAEWLTTYPLLDMLKESAGTAGCGFSRGGFCGRGGGFGDRSRCGLSRGRCFGCFSSRGRHCCGTGARDVERDSSRGNAIADRYGDAVQALFQVNRKFTFIRGHFDFLAVDPDHFLVRADLYVHGFLVRAGSQAGLQNAQTWQSVGHGLGIGVCLGLGF